MALLQDEGQTNNKSENSCQNHVEETQSEIVSCAFSTSNSVPITTKHEVKPEIQQNGSNIGQQHQNGTPVACNASSAHAAESGAADRLAQTPTASSQAETPRKGPNAPARLLKLQDVPRHLQFNPYILTGYRHQMKAKECIASLKHFHNETINILTHGLPFVFGMLYMPFLLPWQDIKIPILPYAHAAGVVAPWFGSSLYHLFMNHHSGEGLYRQLLKWDVIGVWVTQSFGALTTICAGLYYTPSFFIGLVIVLYMGLALRAFTDTVFARGPWQRRMGFGLLFAIRTAIFLFRLTPYGGGHPKALIHVFLQDAWSAVGAVISAIRVPERWAPGWFDYAFNSHNIMHVLVVMAAVHMHWAAEKDLVWLNEKAAEAMQ